jgi:hypothetical protein
MGQPAYLTATSQKSLAPGLSQLVESIVRTMSAAFGSFLIVEVWFGLEETLPESNVPLLPKPAFNIILPKQNHITKTVGVLENELAAIKIHQTRAKVHLVHTGRTAPSRLPVLLPEAIADELNCVTLGIVVRPIYRQAETGENLPLVHQAMMRDFNQALQRTFFSFVRNQTKYRPPHYQMLGRHAMVKAVWTIDQQLAQISSSFDFLLQVTPVNVHTAWAKFKRQRFEHLPMFHYRPHVQCYRSPTP